MKDVGLALTTAHYREAAVSVGASAQALEVLLSSIQSMLELPNDGTTDWAVLPHVASAGGKGGTGHKSPLQILHLALEKQTASTRAAYLTRQQL